MHLEFTAATAANSFHSFENTWHQVYFLVLTFIHASTRGGEAR